MLVKQCDQPSQGGLTATVQPALSMRRAASAEGSKAWGQAQESPQGTSEGRSRSLRGRDSEICHLKQTQSEKEEASFVILILVPSFCFTIIFARERDRRREGGIEREPLAYNSPASVLTVLPVLLFTLFLYPAPLPCGLERARRGETAETQTSGAWAEKVKLSHHASRCARSVPTLWQSLC